MTEPEKIEWLELQKLRSHAYQCGYCANRVASSEGYLSTAIVNKFHVGSNRIFICPHCTRPTYVNERGTQLPMVLPGEHVKNLQDPVKTIYKEAREAAAASAPTASVMMSRVLLAHVAVSEGATPGQTFKQYVEWLAANGYVPPKGKPLLERIKDIGNEANHDLTIMTTGQADELIDFAGMLLRFVYDYPSRIQSHQTPTAQ